MNPSNNKGTIFNIQRFSIHDGPGIRTIVFLKGCPIRCAWCANPESQKMEPQLMWTASKCIGCFKCMNTCPQKAITICDNQIRVNQQKCLTCFKCAGVCPSQALHTIGEEKYVDEILDEIEKDEIFYSHSDGGITLSGGEPLAQPEFAIALLKEASHRRLNCAIETTGFVRWEILKEASSYLDTVLFDIKAIDDEKHKKYTGVSNKNILENFKKLCAYYPNLSIIVRTPVIPGFNDDEKDLFKIIDFIKGYKNVSYEFLPYHRFGESKYQALGRQYSLSEAKLDEECFEQLKALAQARYEE